MVGEPMIYSMDADSAAYIREEYDLKDKYGQPVSEWGTEQEAYYMIYPVRYQTLPSLGVFGTLETGNFISSAFWVVYGRNGLIEFEAQGLYDVKESVQEGLAYSPLDVIEAEKAYYNDIILDNDIRYSNMRFTYIITCSSDSVNEWKIEPVWILDGKKIEEDSDKGPVYRLVVSLTNAVSGERLPLTSYVSQ